jgi:hypothetical protein
LIVSKAVFVEITFTGPLGDPPTFSTVKGVLTPVKPKLTVPKTATGSLSHVAGVEPVTAVHADA